jgi:thioredoxin-related protein
MKIKITLLFVISLLAFSTNISAQESTTNLLKKAQAKAKKEDKAVFIKFEASWCGWCKKMNKDMKADGTKHFFDTNYVIVPVVVKESKGKEHLENSGSTELLKKYKGDKAGLPFWVILDADLNVITDAYNAKGENLGGPASKDEVDVLIEKLKQSAKKVTENDIAAIKKQFILKN